MNKEYCLDDNGTVLYSFNVCDFCGYDITGEKIYSYEYKNFTEYACAKCAAECQDKADRIIYDT